MKNEEIKEEMLNMGELSGSAKRKRGRQPRDPTTLSTNPNTIKARERVARIKSDPDANQVLITKWKAIDQAAITAGYKKLKATPEWGAASGSERDLLKERSRNEVMINQQRLGRDAASKIASIGYERVGNKYLPKLAPDEDFEDCEYASEDDLQFEAMYQEDDQQETKAMLALKSLKIQKGESATAVDMLYRHKTTLAAQTQLFIDSDCIGEEPLTTYATKSDMSTCEETLVSEPYVVQWLLQFYSLMELVSGKSEELKELSINGLKWPCIPPHQYFTTDEVKLFRMLLKVSDLDEFEFPGPAAWWSMVNSDEGDDYAEASGFYLPEGSVAGYQAAKDLIFSDDLPAAEIWDGIVVNDPELRVHIIQGLPSF
ncbi:hypothetical protein IFR05_016711 [Cadophora sp. M221]|nr:hypothetical protein IFR05_016711 [Cadophora sp. M221]